jgi:hypothetical protein
MKAKTNDYAEPQRAHFENVYSFGSHLYTLLLLKIQSILSEDEERPVVYL